MQKITFKRLDLFKSVLLIYLLFNTTQIEAQNCGAIVTLYQTVAPVPATAGISANVLKYNRFTNRFTKVATLPIGMPDNSDYNSNSKYIYLSKEASTNVFVVYDPANNFQYVGELTVTGVGASKSSNVLFSEGNFVGYRSGNTIVRFDVVNISGSYVTNNARTVASVTPVTGLFNAANDYVSINNVLYGVTGTIPNLVSIASNGILTTRSLTLDKSAFPLDNTTGATWGAAWSDAAGSLYVFNNSDGDIYRVDNVENSSSTILKKIFRAQPSSNNDGFGCEFLGDLFDNDGDGILDTEDLDDDNDGITDLIESGGIDPLADADGNGIPNYSDTSYVHPLFGAFVDVNADGVNDVFDSDLDGIPNSFDSDSDNDGCFDTVEAGFSDPDNNGALGVNPVVVNASGLVVGQVGYTTSLATYVNVTIAANSVITVQPANQTATGTPATATFSVTATGGAGVSLYQWQERSGSLGSWSDLVNGGIYSGVNTKDLVLTAITCPLNDYQYRVVINQISPMCAIRISNPASLNTGTPPVAPTVGAITPPTCLTPTGSVVLDGLPSGNWTINPGNISGTGAIKVISNLTPDSTYNFTVTNAAGCTSKASTNVVITAIPKAPTLIINNPVVICSGSTVNLSAAAITDRSDSGLSFSYWKDVGANILYDDYKVASAGTYYIKGTTAVGCYTIKPVKVTEQAQPNAGTDGILTVCAGRTPTDSELFGSLKGSPDIGGTWSNVGLVYTYTVSATLPCSGNATATVTVKNVVVNTPSIFVTQPNCVVTTGSIELRDLPIGNWIVNPGNIAGTGNTKVINGLISGNYSYTVTDENGCTSLASTFVTILNSICAITEKTPSINGNTGWITPSLTDNDKLNGNPVVIGVNPGDVTISGIIVPAGLTLNPNGTVIVAPNTPAGEYNLKYRICEVTNPMNCSEVTSVIVVGFSSLNALEDDFKATPINGISGGTTQNILNNDSQNGFIVNISDVDLYPIDPFPKGIALNVNGTVSVAPNTAGGDYVLTYQICEKLNGSNCSTAKILVFVEIPSIAIIKTAKLNDENGNGNVESGETISYSFIVTNTGNVPLYNIMISDPLPGITISGGVINLNVNEIDKDSFSAEYTIKQDDINNGNISNQATVYGTTRSGITVEDQSDNLSNVGDSPTVLALVGCVIKVFNAISPNGDSHNERFYIQGLECYPDNRVEIYNRWGVLVFERENYNNEDRAFRGISEGRTTIKKSEELPVGTYYYILKYKDKQFNWHQEAGYLYIN